jgi:hypothetical protein
MCRTYGVARWLFRLGFDASVRQNLGKSLAVCLCIIPACRRIPSNLCGVEEPTPDQDGDFDGPLSLGILQRP